MSGECMDGDDSVTPTPTQSSQISSHSSDPPPNSSATSSPPFKPSQTPPSFSSREDCWSPEATFTLIEAWGQRYLILNRGNLRRNHWQDVAAAVNSQHHSKSTKLPRTDIQCKNRIDTVKKKYKIEKSRVSNSAGRYLSPWPFFSLLDSFIGDSFKSSPAILSTRRKVPPPLPPPPSSFIGDSFKPSTAIVSTSRKVPPAFPPPPSLVPVGPRSKRPITRPAHIWVNEAVPKRRFSAVERDSEEELESCEHDSRGEWPMKGCSTIAEAITKCGEIYKRVEEEKLRQMIELEKQRMLFTRDLEIQRMKFIAESQVELERVKSRRGFDKRSTYRR